MAACSGVGVLVRSRWVLPWRWGRGRRPRHKRQGSPTGPRAHPTRTARAPASPSPSSLPPTSSTSAWSPPSARPSRSGTRRR